MDHPSWLPWPCRQLIADFRGVKPGPQCADILRSDPHETFLQDRVYDMQWERDEDGRWTYRWVGGSFDFRPGRPVWPATSPEWAQRCAAKRRRLQ